MIAMGAATLAGIYNWAANLYSYNRDAWMNDIQVTQEHHFQKDNLKIAMHAMDREEVRDLMDASINKINNAILVSALILSLAGEMLFEGQIPQDTPPFLLNAYMLCLGSAIFHLVLSIIFGLIASQMAYDISTTLLTSELKPKWKKHFATMEARKSDESVRAFDDQPLHTMLRPPLASRLSGMLQPSKECPSGQLVGHSDSADSLGNSLAADTALASSFSFPDSKERDDHQIDGDLQSSIDLNGNHRNHESMGLCKQAEANQCAYHWSEDKWAPFCDCMFKCVILGSKNLLEACAYICTAMLFGKYRAAWAFWAVQVIFTTLNVLLVHFCIVQLKKDHSWVPWMKWVMHSRVAPALPALGPLFMAAAAATGLGFEIIDWLCVPAAYFCHFVEYVFSIAIIFHGYGSNCSGGPHVPWWDAFRKWQFLCSSSCRPTPNSVRAECNGYSQLVLADEAHETRGLEKSRRGSGKDPAPIGPHAMLLSGLLVIGLLWLSALIWAVYSECSGTMKFKNKTSFLPFAWLRPNQLYTIDPLNIRSPGPYFQPHAITCPKPEFLFLADRFRVWQINVTNYSSDSSDLPKHVHCDINGTIADIASRCDKSKCWPVVLLNEAPPRLVDCSRNETRELRQDPGNVRNLATDSSKNEHTLEALYVSENNTEVIKYVFDGNGYAPHWVVSKSPGRKILGLDVVENHLLSFQDNGEVVLTDLESGLGCGTWIVPKTDQMIGGGCADFNNTAHILVKGRHYKEGFQHRLLIERAYIPIVKHCVITTN